MNEPLCRFSLRTLCVWLVFAGLFCAAFVNATDFWVHVTYIMVLLILGRGLVLAFKSRNAKRVFYVSFVVASLMYSAMKSPNTSLFFFPPSSFAPGPNFDRRWFFSMTEDLHTPHEWRTAIGLTDPRVFPKFCNAYFVAHHGTAFFLATLVAYVARATYVVVKRKSIPIQLAQ